MLKTMNKGWFQMGGRWLALLVVSLTAQLALGAAYELEFGSKGQESEVRLSIGKSQIIRSPVALDQVVIGNPNVADIKLLTSRQVLILGIKPGHTNLVFKDKNRSLVAVMDVVVGYDLNGIKRKIYEVLPKEKGIEIRGSNDSVILSGMVSDVQSMEKTLSIARSYVPKNKVVNLLQVGGGHQVMLEVKVSEVSRNNLKELGIQTFLQNDGSSSFAITGSDLARPFGLVDYFEQGGALADTVNIRLSALEEKGLARTLAEPNIVAMSGQEAQFLVGGEIPIPVARDNSNTGFSTITVDYKEFGVGLKFTPTVLSGDQINLKMQTEVSDVDESRGFSIGGGINIPTIATRRMGTTIEMADGQSFAIGGLLENNIREAVNQFPWLGDIPVLGALFRSNEFLREETELVVVVTPRLVKPVNYELELPTDNVVPPSQFAWYLLGALEGDRVKRNPPRPNRTSQAQQSGYQGVFGHE